MSSNLSKKTYWIYGIGVSYFILDQLYNQWLSYYYLPPANETSLVPLLKQSYLILAFIFARFIDAVSDPLIGYWSDNSKSRFGKRSFFMMLGGLPLGIFMIMYFYPPKNSPLMMLTYLSVVGGLYFIAYTLVGAPYNALIPDLAKTKEEQLNLSTVQSVFRLFFTGVALVLPGILIKTLGGGNTELGIRKMIILLSTVAVIGIYICVFFLKETELVKNNVKYEPLSLKKSLSYLKEKEIMLYFMGFFFFFSGFNILRGVLTYYLTIIMKLPISSMTTVSVVLFGVAGLTFPATNYLGKKYSYKKILILDILLLVIGTSGLIMVKESSTRLPYLLFVICGLGLSGSAFIFPQAMLSQLSIKLSETRKVSLEGFLFGIQGLFLKLAFLVQQVVVLSLITVGSEVNSGSLKSATATGLRATLITALIFFLISLIFYKLKREE